MTLPRGCTLRDKVSRCISGKDGQTVLTAEEERGRAEVNVIGKVQPVYKIRVFEYRYPLFRIVSLNQNMAFMCPKKYIKRVKQYLIILEQVIYCNKYKLRFL
jgi:hypothetical protein